MSRYVLGLQEIDKGALPLVGGKGANLGELARLEGVRVPDGFCVTTEAFKSVVGGAPEVQALLDRLDALGLEDREQLRELSAEVRAAIEAIALPEAIVEEVASFLFGLGEEAAYAVRSSATAEDLPSASFAGQHDSYLNVKGKTAVLEHIRKCWASLFTERAVVYRLQNGFGHRQVHLAVVVQKMLFPEASGILFTADPVSGHRKVSSIDAGFGLGEALVSGLVNADVYKVRGGRILDKSVATKKLAIAALPGGGTEERTLASDEQTRQVLSDDEILALERLGRRIEAHFGSPQDIEWCLIDGAFSIVQSRPITTLFPVPEVDDGENHVYVSVGHQQMMTDPMKPLGLSFFRLQAPRPMYTAAGRLFVDVAPELASLEKRNVLVNVLGKSDPLIKDALTTILERGDFILALPDEREAAPPQAPQPSVYQTLKDYDPAIVSELIEASQATINQLKRDIRTKSGPELFDFIREDFQNARRNSADSQSLGVIMTGMNAAHWLNDNMLAWLGEKNVADTLTQSVPHNVTSEMGLALLDLADVIRPYPKIVEYLQQAKDERFLDELTKFEGGQEVRNAFAALLAKYGMRCVGEIDITRPRWSEQPLTLVPLILGNIKQFEPGAGLRKFEQGRQEALNKEQDLLARLKLLPDGEEKARETKRMIDLVRNFSGYREYPKYVIVSRYMLYKQALLKEAERLVLAGVLHDEEDIAYLSFDELHDAVRTHQVDQRFIAQRKEAFAHYERLTPPRIFTSEGESVSGRYKRENLPAGALIGLPVSSGMIEGRARVISRLEEATLEEGDILVTAFTDPSWTPVFVSIKGLVTEVGGLMTHGSVIAREYGLPAVVGVEGATRRIKDGQRIRVHGTEGYVEILESLN